MFEIFFYGWFLIGLLATAFLCYNDYVDGIDFRIKELLIALLCTVFGPITVVIGICMFFEKNDVLNMVVIKGKKSDK